MTDNPLRRSSPLLALTSGDPAGIGPEVIIRALQDADLPGGVDIEVLAGNGALRFKKGGDLEPFFKIEGISPGISTADSARSALSALQRAVRGWKEGRYDAIVTGPIQKETMAQVDPTFVGQTEFFARACGQADEQAVMVMADPQLTVALVTTHCSLRHALDRLTPQKIVHTATQLHQFLVRQGHAHPRLAMAGVNPHAGEHGLFGDEETRILKPALEELNARGINITGPHSPDTVFYQATHGLFDGVVCTYHDQGLIPFKLLAFHTGVNVTLGLPLIRTSPDHGTALGLVGKNEADHHSMLAAIQLAAQLTRSRPTCSREGPSE